MANEDAGPRPKSPERRWQSTGPGPADGLDRGSRRRTLLFLLTGLFLVLVSSVVVWVLFIRFQSTPIFFLGIGISEYNARSLPVNAFVEDDIKRLVRRFPKGMHDHPVTNSEKLLRNELKELKDGMPLKALPETHLIVYFSALAVVRDGKVYVLPADADPDKPAQWLDVQAVYDAVKDCPARQKLLILDLAHGLVDPRWGVLSDRVAETLQADLEKNAPPFPVLVSCSAGQTSLTSQALSGSVFAYYVDQALQGRADVDDTQTVSVSELYDFVKSQVSRWALVNRGLRQEPRLFRKEKADFAVPYERGQEAEDAPKKLEPYPEALNDGWKQRDRLAGEGAFQRAPRPMYRLEAALQRQDDRWRRGAPPTKDEVRNIKAALDEFPRAMDLRRLPRRSLALAGAKEDLDLAGAAARLLDADKKDSAKTTEELVKLLKSADDKKADFAQQAWAVIQALCQMPQIGPAQLAIADATLTKLLDGIKAKPAYAEVLCVQRVAQFARERDPAPDSKYLQALLRTTRSHQAMIAALERGPEALPWIAAAVAEADRQRRQAERNLLGNQPRATWPEALDDLKSAQAGYELARRAADALQVARVELDRAYAWLPAFGQLLCEWPVDDPYHEKAWEKAAAQAATIQAFFDARPLAAANPVDAFSMETPARELKADLDELKAMLDKRMDRAGKDATGQGQQKLLGLLASPLLSAEQRVDLSNKQQALAAKLQADFEGDAAPEKPAFPGRSVGPLRARMSLALLQWAGVDVDPKVANLAKKTQWAPGELAMLERSLQELWGREYPDPLREGPASARADSANRLRSPWDQDRRAELLDRDPTRKLQTEQRKDFAAWLKASYQAELRNLQPPPQDAEARDFFTRAAEDVRP